MPYYKIIKAIFLTLLSHLPFVVVSQVIDFVPNQVLVKWETSFNDQEITSFKKEINAISVKSMSTIDVDVLTLDTFYQKDIAAIIKKYKTHPGIAFIEPNYIYNISKIVPNDPKYETSWGLNNTGQNGGAIGVDIKASEAWEAQKTSPSIKIAIIDTGIDWQHPDLVDNIWQNGGEDIDGDGHVLEWNGQQWVFDPDDENGIDDDGNGFVDDFIGWDFRNNDNNPMDENAHGTHVAGIVGAKGNNGIGITGVTWDVQLAALKFLGRRGSGRISDAIDALNYAVQMGMPISNNSWGGYKYSLALKLAIQHAAAQNHIYVAAAGNDNNNNDNSPAYPTSFDIDNIISVAAIDRNNNRSNFSNYGTTSVDIAAPGSAVLSCFPNNQYQTISGTSMAAPFVTGACALLLEKNPTLTYHEVKNQLLDAADLVPDLDGRCVSEGRLNLCKLLTGTCSENISCATQDSLALVDLYQATNGPNWRNTWDLTQPMSSWHGVTTNDNGCLLYLSLGNNLVGGNIPAEIGSFSKVEYINLSANNFTSIAPEIGNLTRLEDLRLNDNPRLGGILPKEIGNLSNLKILYLNNTLLQGALFPEIGNLTNLEILSLYRNQITSIPPEIGNLNKLRHLSLYFNQLSSLPPEIGQLSSLTYLNAHTNQITSLPSTIGQLTNLIEFSVSTNQITGNIPIELTKLNKLQKLFLSNNQISGEIPSELSDLTKLEYLYVDNNLLVGCFPESLKKFCTINASFSENVGLPNNGDFTNFCTDDIGICQELPCRKRDSLALVALYHSTDGANWTNSWDLNTPVSTWYGIETFNSGCVKAIKLYNNGLKGTLPPEIGNLKNLLQLWINNDSISGNIPTELGSLISLRELYITKTQLSGSIPAELGQLLSLTFIYLFDNQLTGSIPPELGNLNIRLLYLQRNRLSGPIPVELGKLSNSLRSIFISDNQLEGCFPEGLNTLCDLEVGYNFTNNPELPGGGDFVSFCADQTGVCTSSVWPGDFNNDGIVDNTDALYWGLACQDTPGPGRPNTSTDWQAQEAYDWTASVNGINNKHQDGDGNGLINIQDLQVLKNNYGKTHSSNTAASNTDGVSLRLEPYNTNASSIEYALFVDGPSDTPVNLHGLACSFDFGNLPIEGARLAVTNSSLQPDTVLSVFDTINNKLDIAITRTNKIDKEVDGLVGILIILVESIAFEDPIKISVKKGSKLVANGTHNALANTTFHDTYAEVAASNNYLKVAVSIVHEDCGQFGAAKLFITGGEMPYDILWNTGARTPTISNLEAGIYSVVVSDANGLIVNYVLEVEGQFLPIYDEDGNLIDCAPPNCSTSLNIGEISNGTRQAQTNLTANCRISSDNSVTFKAGAYITLSSGFTVEAGATFHALIETCSPSNSNNNNNSRNSQPISTLSNITPPPETLSLNIHPSPFSYQTVIEYDLPSASPVQLIVSDMRGRQLKTLVHGIDREAGKHQVTLFADGMESGIYLVSLQTKTGIETQKIIVVR